MFEDYQIGEFNTQRRFLLAPFPTETGMLVHKTFTNSKQAPSLSIELSYLIIVKHRLHVCTHSTVQISAEDVKHFRVTETTFVRQTAASVRVSSCRDLVIRDNIFLDLGTNNI